MRFSFRSVSLAAIAILAGITCSLFLRNRELEKAFQGASEKVELPYVGMYVPVVATSTTEGANVTLGKPSSKAQVLYFFNTRCPYCKASTPVIKQLQAALVDCPNVDFVGVSQDSREETIAYLRKLGLSGTFVSLPNRRTLSLYHASGVPEVVVIDTEGRISFAVGGTLSAAQDVAAILAAVRSLDG